MGHPIVCFLRNKPNLLVIRASCNTLHDNLFGWHLCRFVTWVCFAGLALFWGCGVVLGGVLVRITGLVIAGGVVNASGRTLTLTLSLREGRGENSGRALTWTVSVQEGRGGEIRQNPRLDRAASGGAREELLGLPAGED